MGGKKLEMESVENRIRRKWNAYKPVKVGFRVHLRDQCCTIPKCFPAQVSGTCKSATKKVKIFSSSFFVFSLKLFLFFISENRFSCALLQKWISTNRHNSGFLCVRNLSGVIVKLKKKYCLGCKVCAWLCVLGVVCSVVSRVREFGRAIEWESSAVCVCVCETEREQGSEREPLAHLATRTDINDACV